MANPVPSSTTPPGETRVAYTSKLAFLPSAQTTRKPASIGATAGEVRREVWLVRLAPFGSSTVPDAEIRAPKMPVLIPALQSDQTAK